MNKLCNDFKLAVLTDDDFKCLIFAQGLVSAEDAEVRRRVLTKLENEQGLTLQKLAEGCQRVISIKCDSKTIEESDVAQIRKIRSNSTAYSPKKDKRQISCSKSRNKQNTNRLKKPPGPCYHCGKWHWMKLCPVKKKTYSKNCNKNNLTHCWYANITRKPKSKIRQAQSDNVVNRNLRKYVIVNIFNNSIKFQLDSSSDISIITWRTWRKLNMPTLLKTDKTAKSVTGENINILDEVTLKVTLNRVTKKLKAYVLKNSDNLFGTDWIENFHLWDCSMSTFCRKIESTTSNSVNLKKKLKQRFPQFFFSGDLGKCSKFKAKLKVKDGAQPVFKKKRNVPFAAQEQINK